MRGPCQGWRAGTARVGAWLARWASVSDLLGWPGRLADDGGRRARPRSLDGRRGLGTHARPTGPSAERARSPARTILAWLPPSPADARVSVADPSSTAGSRRGGAT